MPDVEVDREKARVGKDPPLAQTANQGRSVMLYLFNGNGVLFTHFDAALASQTLFGVHR